MKKFYLVAIIAIFTLIMMPADIFAASSEWDAFKTGMTAPSGTVELTVDLAGEAEAVTVTGDVTLDLAGKTLTLNEQLIVEGKLTIGGNGKIYTENLLDMIVVKPGATLVVNEAKIENLTYYGAAIQTLGETGKKTQVTINKDAVITANCCAYISRPGGQGITMDIYGTLNGLYNEKSDGTGPLGGSGLYVNGNVIDTSENASVINIYDGATIVGENGAAVYAAGYANWNIKGGYFEGNEALSIKSGSFNITGGSFYAYGPYVNPVFPEYNGSEASGSAISITSNQAYKAKKIVMNIENADVFSENGYAVLEVATDIDTNETTYVQKIEVNSGLFYGGKEAVFAENVNSFVNGGIYNTDVDAYKNDSIDIVEEEGVFFVGTLNKVNVKETENGKVEVSKKEAVVDQFVEIKATANEGYKVGTIKVTDAAGKEVEVVDGMFLMPDSEVTVEVAFEKLALDNTPATGSIDTVMLAGLIVSAIAVVAIIARKKVGNNI